MSTNEWEKVGFGVIISIVIGIIIMLTNVFTLESVKTDCSSMGKTRIGTTVISCDSQEIK
jgi:hypothetical protein